MPLNVRTLLTITVASLCLAAGPTRGRAATESVSSSYPIAGRFLHVPLIRDPDAGRKNVQRVTLRIDGELFGTYLVPWARVSDNMYHGFLDLSRHQGRTLKIELAASRPDDLAPISFDDRIRDSKDLYREQYRPQFHFTTRRGYLNDPNGLIYHDGEYHLYYQHIPLAVFTSGANKTWGHAVSRDLVHWEELPPVLLPDPITGSSYSGAMFVDAQNQLQRKTGPEDVLVAFYLRTKSGLSLAYSNDRGRTFTDYEGNPVIPNREGARIDTPRPFWHEPTGRWVAPLMDFFVDPEGQKRRCVGFYSSADLKTWTFESRVEQDKFGDELTGCVDFFQLPLDGDTAKKKWVMVFIDGSYIVGNFDGKVFSTLAGPPASTGDRIGLVARGNFYATMTFENAPNDRRVQMAWMASPPFPATLFNQQMSVPAELTLHSAAEGPRMRMNPIQELTRLRTKTHEWTHVALQPGENPFAGIKGDLFDLEVEFVPANDTEVVFDLRGHKVAYDSRTKTLTTRNDFKHPPAWRDLGRNFAMGLKPVSRVLDPINGVVRLRIMLDRTSVEVFGNDGRIVFPTVIFPDSGNLSIGVTCHGGAVRINHLRVHELKSAWAM